MPDKDTKCRKWQLTINNPQEHSFSHTQIREALAQLSSIIYWCMSDEIGLNGETPHTHIFLAASSAIRFSTIKNLFPEAHIEMARGTCQENRDYIFKQGKWQEDTKNETNLPDTHEEWGEMPIEQPGRRNDLTALRDAIRDGMGNTEILDTYPQYMFRLSEIERVRQTLREEEAQSTPRLLTVTYIFGSPGTGKTRSVMEQHGYASVFRVTGYGHGCFDAYSGQDVILFDEFASNIKITDMNNYLDLYPLPLPCRYVNKWACYTKVYIISNIPLERQYPNVQIEYPDIWQAFLRRIRFVVHYYGENEFDKYTLEEYQSRSYHSSTDWQEIPTTGDLPF